MKKYIILTLVMHTTACQLFSQSNWHLQVNAGYGVSTSLTHMGYMATDAEITIDTTIENNKYTLISLSSGKGPVISVGIGRQLSDVFELEMNLAFKKAGLSFYEIAYRWDIAGGYYVRFKQFSEYSGYSFSFAPVLKTKIPVMNNSIYFNTGLLFHLSKLEEYTDLRIFNTHPEYYPLESYTSNMEYENTVGIGFLTGIGMKIPIMDKLYLCPEINYKLMKYTPLSAEITEYKYRGEDRLDELTVQEKEYVYVDEYDDQENKNPDKPTKELKQNYHLDHIAFSLGIRLEF